MASVFLSNQCASKLMTNIFTVQKNLRKIVGFTRVAENINDLSKSGEPGNENDSSASTGDHPDLDIKTSISPHSSGGLSKHWV
jgi:hypothetical protein